MSFSTHKERFYNALPGDKAQFGNLVTLRERQNRTDVPGIHQTFLASVIQFQPLVELHLLNDAGGSVPWESLSSVLTPVEETRKFRTDNYVLEQRSLVDGNDVMIEFSLQRLNNHPTPPVLQLSGACLFSPQGVPYHWDEERMIVWERNGGTRLSANWNDEVSFGFAFSEELEDLGIRALAEGDVLKEPYFTSFNLKKRFTYSVEREGRIGGAGTTSLEARNAAYSGLWRPHFDSKGRAVLSISFGLGESPFGKTPSRQGEYENRRSKIESDLDEFIQGIPSFESDDPDLQNIYYTSWYILWSGTISLTEERFKHPFTSVNKFHYYNQFFWDSAFQAIAWLWHNSPDHAESEMKNFVSNQWRNGMIPYELFLFSVNGREWMDGDAKTTGTTQPPVIGITVREVFLKYRNSGYLRYFYDSFLRYEQWLYRYRDLGNRGLSAYVNIWETGWDNSPRLDKAARNRVLDPYIEGVDFNVYIYLLRKTILDMARWLERPEPADVKQRMEASRESMNRFMYDPADGFYYDLEAATDVRVPVKTAAGILPLMTDVPDKDKKQVLTERYLMSEKEFLTGTPVPSVPRSEESYDPLDFWRGANWPQITWSMLYGTAEEFPDAASDILDRFLGTTAGNGNCFEYYHSETGEGVGLPFQGWGALYTDIIIRFVVGIQPTEKGFRLQPLSKKYTDFTIENLHYHGLSMTVARKGELWALDWGNTGSAEFRYTEPFEVETAGSKIRFLLPKKSVPFFKIKGGLSIREQ